ncbi:TPA: hypothetical protein ACMDP8_003006 [Vibrio cholerae]|nr:hypothetical protein [Vibrio cholerae]
MLNKLFISSVTLLFSVSVTAGVMEELTVDPETGVIIAVKDYEEPALDPISDTPKLLKSKVAVEDISTNADLYTDTKSKPKSKPLVKAQPNKTVKNNILAEKSKSAVVNPVPTDVIQASSVTETTIQPKTDVKPAAQDSLLSTVWSYMRVVKPNDRIFVDSKDGLVYFYLKEGSLKDNINALVAATGAYGVVTSGISDNHRVEAPMWISGNSTLHILDSILLSYEVPFPIRASAKGNRIVEIYYDTKRRGI